MYVLLMFVFQAHAFSTIAVAASTATYPQMTISAISKGLPNELASEEVALNKCKERGGTACKPYTIENACIAVASNDEFSTFFPGVGGLQSDAQKAALQKCRSESGNDNCSLRTSVCDYHSCKKVDDYNACLRGGDTMFPGSAKEFCHSQFC